MTSQFADVNGCRLHYRRAGSGPVLLLLHGASGTGPISQMIEPLTGGFDVIVPDHPGYVPSGDPDWIANMSDMAYFYLDVMEALDLRNVHLLGHSMGGWIAAEIAVRNTTRLKSLSLVSAVGLRVKGAAYGDIFLWSPEETARHLYQDENLTAQALAFEPSEEEIEIMLKARETAAKLCWSPRFHNPDLEKWLHRIDVPVWLNWGRQDKIVPLAYGDRYAELLPDADYTVLDDCGHVPYADQPDEFFRAYREFLARAGA